MSIKGMPGTVITQYGKNLTIEDQEGNLISAIARRRLPQLICGDRIRWQKTDNDKAIIEAVEDRITLLSRPDQRGRAKLIAANIDQMIIVSAIDKDNSLQFNDRLIDHYLVAAETLGIQPVILINKTDLVDIDMLNQIYNHFRLYSTIGYPTIFTNNSQQTGYPELIEQLYERTSIFVGESGVGKSSLINNLLPDHDIRIGELSAVSGKGMHTTTATTLYHLPHGGELIDSPGVREFGLSLDNEYAIANGYREFQSFIGLCKFRNCRHLGEQGCAIINACNEGLINRRRLDSYQAMAFSLTAKQRS